MKSKLLTHRRTFFSRLAAFGILACALVAGLSQGEAKPKKSAYISKFGVMSPGPGGTYRVYAETTYIYKNLDKEYVHGFEVSRKDQQRFMGYFEVRFPEPITVSPEMEKSYTVLEGGRVLRSTDEIYWEIFSSPFWFSDDDPLGTYEIKIFIDGNLYRTVSYEVVPFESGLTF